MIVKFWGVRGSIPVSGKEYLKYGGSTTCVEITTKNGETIIVDAGTGIRKLGIKLTSEKRKNINLIFTHAHWDHIMGFPFFKPLYAKETKIKMFGCPFAQGSVKNLFSETMHPPYFPVDFNDIKAKISYSKSCEREFLIDTVKIMPIPLSHPNSGLGYKFTEDGKSFVFLTDNELTYRHKGGLDFAGYVKFCRNADLLVHDAEFTGKEYKFTKTWGHSVFNDALRLALSASVKKFILWHHNQERTDTALDKIVGVCRKIIEKNGKSLNCSAAREGAEVKL
ncbi:MAG TPA: MBL fold metallo-hydrolase [Elusimicrobia bacterium]|nr:MBL fold metallo-hydrolase [Elusimicrobiota bacterium]